MVIVVCLLSIGTFAAVPETIKVGLESVYKNKASINISGDRLLEIGTFSEYGFSKLGTLSSREITITNINHTYYDLGFVSNTYDEAVSLTNTYGGVVSFTPGGNFRVYTNYNDGSLYEVVNTSEMVEVYDENNEVILIAPKKGELVFRGYDSSSGLYLTQVGNKNKYRGAIGIAGESGLTPYNVLPVEEYLYGVVPKEMPASWPIEALKAQAVAARSIAAHQYNRYISRGYNVLDTTATQAYGGYNGEQISTTSAVDATQGEVIKYNGSVAEALYSSTSGGITAAAKEVWGNDIAYLQSVVDTYETEPAMAPWTYTITLSELDTCLRNVGASIGSAEGMQITQRSESGRVSELVILGTNGTYTINNENVRSFFGALSKGSLKSRLFSFYGPIDSNTIIAGGGNKDNESATAKELVLISAKGTSTVSTEDIVVVSQIEAGPLAVEFTLQSSNEKIQIKELAKDITNKSTSKTTTRATTSTLGTEKVLGDATIYGVGYGHGVGMSQSGAKGMAKAGFSYDEILKFYYKGISIGY